MRKRVNRERKEEHALFDWASRYPLMVEHLIHITNEGKRSWAEGKSLKRAGLKKGVSDLFLSLPSHTYSGLWIELKAKQANGYYSKPTPEQLDWLLKKKETGYDAYCCQGWEQAKNRIVEYLLNSKYAHYICQ